MARTKKPSSPNYSGEVSYPSTCSHCGLEMNSKRKKKKHMCPKKKEHVERSKQKIT
jgi:predicted Zn-ribbon and HTH transcriptional regulator